MRRGEGKTRANYSAAALCKRHSRGKNHPSRPPHSEYTLVTAITEVRTAAFGLLAALLLAGKTRTLKNRVHGVLIRRSESTHRLCVARQRPHNSHA